MGQDPKAIRNDGTVIHFRKSKVPVFSIGAGIRIALDQKLPSMQLGKNLFLIAVGTKIAQQIHAVVGSDNAVPAIYQFRVHHLRVWKGTVFVEPDGLLAKIGIRNKEDLLMNISLLYPNRLWTFFRFSTVQRLLLRQAALILTSYPPQADSSRIEPGKQTHHPPR